MTLTLHTRYDTYGYLDTAWILHVSTSHRSTRGEIQKDSRVRTSFAAVFCTEAKSSTWVATRFARKAATRSVPPEAFLEPRHVML